MLTRTNRLVLATLAFVGAAGSSALGGTGVCADFASGYGLPGLGTNDGGSVFAVYDDGSGAALYMDAVSVGGVATNGVAKRTATGWAPCGTGLNGAVWSMASFNDGSGSKLYVGGGFGTAGGQPIFRFARWDGVQWSTTPQILNNGPQCLVVHNDGSGDALYAAGNFFNTVGGIDIGNVAKWDGLSWTGLGSGIDSANSNPSVGDMISWPTAPGGPLLVLCGGFSIAGGNAVQGVAAWNGASWTPLSTISGDVRALAVFHDGVSESLYAAGQFSVVNPGGTQANNIARWTGSQWVKVGAAASGAGLNDQCDAMTVFNDGNGPRLFVGGNFNGGSAGSRLTKWDGSAFLPVGAGLNNRARSVFSTSLPSGNRLWIGGDFDQAGNKPSRHIAEYGIACSAPVFTLQPVNVTASFGTTVTFRVAAEGVRPMSFQWRRNGVPVQNSASISGATTELLGFGAWSLNDEGVYDVVATNALGSVVSNSAVLQVNGGGVTGDPLTVTPVLVKGQAVPGSTTEFYVRYTTVSASLGGQEAVMRGFRNTNPLASDGNDSVMLWTGSALSPLFKMFDPAPGLPGGVIFTFPSGGSYCFDSVRGLGGGRVLFSGTIGGTGVTNSNNHAMWYRSPSSTSLVARKGSQPAGTPAGTVYSTLALSQSIPTLRATASGLCVFGGVASGPGLAFPLSSGVWGWTPTGGAFLVAIAGDAAPGTATTFAEIREPLRLSPTGQMALRVVLNDGKRGVWAGVAGGLAKVAATGDQAAGFPAGWNYNNFDIVLVLDDGQVAFNATVTGPSGGQGSGVFVTSGGVPTLVARNTDPAPGAGAGNTFSDFRLRAVNGLRTLVFTGTTSGCSGCAQRGLWRWSPADGVQPVAVSNVPPVGLPAGSAWNEFGLIVSVNDDEDVVFMSSATVNGGSHNLVHGWKAGYGLFPISVPGTQLDFGSGLYRTCVSAFLGADDDSVPGVSNTGLSDDGDLLFTANAQLGHSGVFKGKFNNALRAFVPCRADINEDLAVNTIDLALFLGAFGTAVPPGTNGDINGDGAVNTIDLTLFLGAFGTTGPC